jgi:chromosome segregation ATPase
MTDIEKLEAENARLRDRISDQEDALRFGEESCARLHRRRDEARRERDEARRERDEALSRVAAEAGKDLAAWARDLDAAEAAHARVVAERDEARADVERLRSAYKRYGAAGVSEALKEISQRDGHHPSDSTR